MARQRYSIVEAVNRILRSLKGTVIPTDAPNTLSGEILSENDAWSDIAELLEGSLPNETLTLPQAVVSAFETYGFVTGSVSNEMVVMRREGTLTVITGTSRMFNRFDRAFFINEVFCTVEDAPTDSSIIVDVNINDASVFAVTKPTIPAGSVTGSSTSLSATAWAIGDYLTLDIDQIGSGTAGSNLIVQLFMRKTDVL